MNTTSHESGGPLADVERVAADDGRWTLIFIRELKHPPEQVWAALTDPAQLRKWAPYTADRDLSSTGDATLTMLDAEPEAQTASEQAAGAEEQAAGAAGAAPADLTASVRRAEPPTLLEYTWGADLLRWELAATGAGTRLTLRHTMQDRDWVPKIAAGWHLCLDVADHLLDGRPVPPIRGADARNHGWDELNDRYTEELD